jgi:hypothetical protein
VFGYFIPTEAIFSRVAINADNEEIFSTLATKTQISAKLNPTK